MTGPDAASVTAAGANSASAKQCQEWTAGLDEFEAICRELGRDHGAFIDDCRWHVEHDAHDLARRRHVVNHRTTIEDRKGPLKVRGS